MSIEWNGEGLPPVGCECELYDCEQWNPVRIKYVGEKYVVTDRTDLGYEVVYCLAEKPERFRPIRTESEINKVVDQAMKSTLDGMRSQIERKIDLALLDLDSILVKRLNTKFAAIVDAAIAEKLGFEVKNNG